MSEMEIPAAEPAHDVLAAEAFGVPSRDPSLRPEPIELPGDPTGIEGPHDILAAEEFALPAAGWARGGTGSALARRAHSSRWVVAGALLAALILVRRAKT